LVEAISVCRSILAQEPLASRDGASDAGLVLAICDLAGLSLCREGATRGPYSLWAAVKPSCLCRPLA
jgi:hypothetical protein